MILSSTASTWVSAWSGDLETLGPQMRDRDLEAADRLITILLCGEQSAIRVFADEVARNRNKAKAVRELATIELDEHYHEKALLQFRRYLPASADRHRIKRQAQRFFAGLGRADRLGLRFAQIGQLDAAVCKIMWHVEHSALNRRSALCRLATLIKQDEARHVAVSRRYAKQLGIDVRDSRDETAHVTEQFVALLGMVADSFEAIGVDSDRLFLHLSRAPDE